MARIAKIAVTEVIRFLKSPKIGSFEIDGFFEKKLAFFKFPKVAKIAVECVLFLENVLRRIYELFGKKSENFQRWKNRKI